MMCVVARSGLLQGFFINPVPVQLTVPTSRLSLSSRDELQIRFVFVFQFAERPQLSSFLFESRDRADYRMSPHRSESSTSHTPFSLSQAHAPIVVE